MVVRLSKVRSVREAPEFFLHGLGEDCDVVSIKLKLTKIGLYRDLPDCTGVRTGVTLVNSVSKLLVSVGLLMVGRNGGGTRLW